jgi:adenosylcobinamide kinase/adenosylcobinamide-phosphate guanylyltransferase
MLPRLTLVLGGARSGKSRYAEGLVEAASDCGTYVATAEPGDDEMAVRIAAHRIRRGPFWRTVEAPLRLAQAIEAEARPDRPVLVDCLTLWLANLMLAGARLDDEIASLLAALRDAAGPVVLVANEVGLGLVPETPLGREFRDAAGQLNQDIAARAERVVFVAAGLPLVLKDGSPHPSAADAAADLPRLRGRVIQPAPHTPSAAIPGSSPGRGGSGWGLS